MKKNLESHKNLPCAMLISNIFHPRNKKTMTTSICVMKVRCKNKKSDIRLFLFHKSTQCYYLLWSVESTNHDMT